MHLFHIPQCSIQNRNVYNSGVDLSPLTIIVAYTLNEYPYTIHQNIIESNLGWQSQVYHTTSPRVAITA